ncbi:hypothetical protein BDA96_03G015600 [Sorghum bicolor]|jgi:cell division cycle 2-like protein|uniref:[RNA-polymerase]-subunit kinase n=2 Tax=Sorghum bicolor TaxID=4558 RepID=C5XKD3_SORBI|nr:putative cyclin-dependent kinase F-2 [Sorghum bicolor]EES00040.1 hypothetical protein SORBI_3003G014200 [Sorghum bicolor]KAG0535873.1 hypothetical protein BDA96_03G015600 [Sorghum bicolor]|eukprot:XP_002454920.1 putative cyclin-dependent kinase F-2 [Sorghum bicolor]
MAAVSELELEDPEPPEEKNNAAAAALALSPAVPWLPAVAERYERREKLGQGMFGDVYKAWDRVSERFVAVKRLSGRTDDDDDRFVATPLPYFEREVMSLAACRGHPSVVQLLATYADGDGDCFVVVTEYAGPMNLREYMDVRLVNGQPFDEDEVRDVMEQLLAGARHAHMAGVVHRDIVPENVMVDMASGRMVYKICGFGMSEPAAMQAAEKDDSGMVASSSPYRAPELFLGSKDYDSRVDTWSLGCIMAELVAGNGLPFFGGTLEKDRDVFNEMMHVVGTEGIVKWPGLERVPSREKAARLRRTGCRERGCLKRKLKELRPEQQVLSPAGFKVLKGLLDSNPDRRLTATAALSKQWFRRRGCLFGACCFMPHGGVAP